MKKILTLTLASAISLALIGCGDSDKSSNPADAVLNFDKNSSAAKYDMKDYLLTTDTNRVLNYSRTILTNEEGKKDFERLPSKDINTTYYSVKTDINGSTVSEYKNDKLDTTNIIYDNKIKMSLDDGHFTDIVKYVDIGDYYLKDVSTFEEAGVSYDFIMSCKIEKHIDKLTINGNEFNDLLKSTCKNITKNKDGERYRGELVDDKYESDLSVYFAKGYGEVRDITDGCMSIKLGDKVISNECQKETVEVTHIN